MSGRLVPAATQVNPGLTKLRHAGGMDRAIALAPALWAELDHIARAERVAVSDVVRDAVQRELYRRQRAQRTERPDEAVLAPLRALLADDFAYAANWDELMRRLIAKGFRLAEAGPGLVLLSHQTAEKVCKASDLGYSHAKLAQRLGCAFPSHRHAHVVGKLIA